MKAIFEKISKEIRGHLGNVLGVMVLDWEGLAIYSDIKEEKSRDILAALVADVSRDIIKLAEIFEAGKVLTCSLRIRNLSIYVVPMKNYILVIITKK